MNKKRFAILIILLIVGTGFPLAQNSGICYIENPTVSSPNFTFEIHYEPTVWTAAPLNGLGDCSWYFDFNNTAISTPLLSFVNPSLLTADYDNFIQVAGVNLDKIAVTTDYLAGLGMGVVVGVKYHLYTVQLTITNPIAESDVLWDMVNTGVFDIVGTSTDETPSGDGDVPLPVQLASFSAADGVNGVVLKWTTESEIENLGFILEKRVAGTEEWNLVVNYKSDETLLGQGTVSFATDYEYLDNLVESGKEYEYRLADVDFNGIVTYHATRFVTVNNFVAKVIPEEFELYAAYPNPFNPHTNIRFDVPEATKVKINIYNQLGQLVRSLHNSELAPGEHLIIWDSKDDAGHALSAGIYLYHIEAGAFNKTQKMILLK